MNRPRRTLLLILIFTAFTSILKAQVWTAKANYAGTPRNRAASFSIPSLHKLYILGGYDYAYQQDMWEYDTLTNAWTQKAAFPGASTTVVAFSINGRGYAGTGVGGGYSWSNLFYEYDPVLDTWTQKANFPGAARGYCFGFATDDKGYIGGGFTGTPGFFVWYNDFYEYDPSTDSWTQKSDYPGAGGALGASGFSVNGLGYAGCGSSIDVTGVQTLHDDFWEFDPSVNSWTQKANYGGGIRGEATAFSICDKGYIGLGYNVPHVSFNNDFWEYDPVTDAWTATINYGGPARAYAPGASIGRSGYAGTGYDGLYFENDFWEFHNTYVAEFFASDDSICAGSTVDFSDQSNFTANGWNWNFPGGNPSTSSVQNPSIIYDTPGTYYVTMLAYNNCDSAIITYSNLITVTAIPPTVNLGNDTLFCSNFSLQLNSGSTGFNYEWSTGDTTSFILVSTPGVYSVNVSNSCATESDTIEITQSVIPYVTLPDDTSVCELNQFSISAVSNVTSFLWSTSDTSSTIEVNSAGTYWVSVTDICGADADSMSITLTTPVAVNLGGDTSICDFGNFYLDGGINADTYIWSTGSTDSTLLISLPGLYWVEASNECGSEIDSIQIDPCQSEFLVPNAFTPNGDGINDVIDLIKLGDASLIDFSIFNRWGTKIFGTDNETQAWNGRYNDTEQEIGVYVFTLKYLDPESGTQYSQSGNITLIR